MAPTFQTALFFTIIGLSFAAPSARQVRWCVISDLEQKKCNDLVGSCNVPKITLVCVLRSSTEDCMTAIKDGQADAMFLDSGDVNKASMDPYNLKSIIAETYSSHKDMTTCLKQRQEALAKKMIGHYIPQCDEKGNYQPQQCHGSTGLCWCVSVMGAEIAGTKTPPGQTRATCERHDLTQCLKERQVALGGDEKVIGGFVPQCDEKGNYQPQQCHGSTGYCWCVNAIGEEIAGTKTPPGQTPATCEKQDLTTCLKQRQEALAKKIIGHYIPQCDEKGNYQAQQCHGSTGHCWCVSAMGAEIAGTKTPPGQTRATCERHDLTQCLKERQVALGGDKKVIGGFVPQCDGKGSYQPQQCHGSTGYCWCVNAIGEEIAGTKTPPGQTPATCKKQDLTTCLKQRQEALAKKIIGHYIPQCDEKGNYQAQQCHGSTGHCWCVSAMGAEIAGTKTPPGQTRATCERHDLTQCLKERQVALGGDKKVVGGFVPQCDEKGSYQPQQCHGSTGYCWCVNAIGEEIAGTKTPPGQTPAICKKQDLTTCLKQRQEALAKKIIGHYIPQCDEKGNYQAQQCHGSTGHCWCVSAMGAEIAGTKTPPGQTRATCERHDLTQCLKERQVALGGDDKVIGGFAPQCDEKGSYQPQQCHGSTGYCWCVNAIGEEIAGTKTSPGQTPATCKKQDLPKCLKERQVALGGDKKVIGGFVPQCDEKGSYQPQQCHGSTGYCWCVNAIGEEIAGTKTPPGQTPATCEKQDLPKCLKERQVALGGDKKVVGGFVPQCDEKGSYQPQQCHGSTGYCWCVSAIGEEIAGTKTPPGQTPATCEKQDLTKCLKQRQEALAKKMIGHYIPQCDEKGNYQAQQCHTSAGHCWCVSAMGTEIAGTKTPPGQTRATCERHDFPKCLKERQVALGGDEKVMGRFVPQCDEEGNYQPQQCHGSTGYCWCVNAVGEEIAGTKTPPGQTPATCKKHDFTKCLKERQVALGGGEKMMGRFVPQCDEKGNYQPQQCHGSTGYCWCVNAIGEEIAGTKTPPGKTPVTCKKHDFPKCLKERQVALGGDELVPGRFVPQCDEKGNYQPQQCHGSTGYCWCVNAIGEEIAGTKTPPGETPATCKKHAGAVVTRKIGDKTEDINNFLMEAQKKQCKLFSSAHGKDLMFDDSTIQLALLSH
ncbi:thyroglobulin-like isoform X5 [Aquarana catesbeiana]|uniref:thyroglobulin-like isoform X5 n=1 Tax=Aquarana catesbeiana TaxID=8400 RepID=UPI003CCA2559